MRNYLKEQFESTPGYEGATPTLSVKELYSPAISFESNLEPSPLERNDELRGLDEPLMVFEDEHDPTWSYESRAYPDLVGFRLTQALGVPVTTAGNGIITDPDAGIIPVGAHRHVWEAPHGPSGPNPVTVDAVAAYVEESTFIHLSGCATEELTLSSGDAGGVMITANGPALVWAPIADPAETPAPESLAVRPFQRRGLKIVTWQGDERNIEAFDIGIATPVEVARSMGVGSEFPDLMEKGEGPIAFTGSVPMRHLVQADLNALKAADRFAVKALWESLSNIGATAYPYRLWLEGDGAQYTGGGPNALESKRRIGASYDFALTSDGVGASTKLTLVNGTASYALNA